ncbi:unnamed protein product [Menidia menidia]|uniref:(Atlantic silverside) hypothetical protein n=1 Tax=Menidia menidia TaxID=238744 RepID=A0A8S4BRN1_9TELE|nr:unnamed protein product [Menidia menidia]
MNVSTLVFSINGTTCVNVAPGKESTCPSEVRKGGIRDRLESPIIRWVFRTQRDQSSAFLLVWMCEVTVCVSLLVFLLSLSEGLKLVERMSPEERCFPLGTSRVRCDSPSPEKVKAAAPGVSFAFGEAVWTGAVGPTVQEGAGSGLCAGSTRLRLRCGCAPKAGRGRRVLAGILAYEGPLGIWVHGVPPPKDSAVPFLLRSAPQVIQAFCPASAVDFLPCREEITQSREVTELKVDLFTSTAAPEGGHPKEPPLSDLIRTSEVLLSQRILLNLPNFQHQMYLRMY